MKSSTKSSDFSAIHFPTPLGCRRVFGSYAFDQGRLARKVAYRVFFAHHLGGQLVHGDIFETVRHKTDAEHWKGCGERPDQQAATWSSYSRETLSGILSFPQEAVPR